MKNLGFVLTENNFPEEWWCYCFSETESYCVAQADLALGDCPTSETRDVLTAGIAGVCHHTWPWIVRLERTCVFYGDCFAQL